MADTYYASIFIQHNNLKQRFADLSNNDTFIIGETGFGRGLNFLNVMQVWQSTVTSTAKLFYISFEKHPLSPADLKAINTKMPNFNQLEEQYYLLLPATHRLSFTHNVFLNLVLGDINETLSEQNFQADVWFLDGFTPTRNSAIWNKQTFSHIARLCKPKASFATYTANSLVSKELHNAGFYVEKAKDFSKRDTLYGYWNGTLSAQKPSQPIPWFTNYTNNKPNKIAIIGGGISGAATAYSLAKRGYSITLYEQGNQLANAASGNYQAMLYGSFSAHKSPILELSYSSYRYSHYLIHKLLSQETQEYQQCGLVQLCSDDKEVPIDFLKTIPQDFCHLLNKAEIEKLAGIPINHLKGLYFPYGLWLNPQCLVEKLTDLPNITVKLGQKIDDLNYNDGWQLKHNGQIIDNADNVVLCNAAAANQFSVTKQLDLRTIRGQISIVRDRTALTKLPLSKTILCGHGYVTPVRHGQYIMGATFDCKNIHTLVTAEDHQQNLSAVQSISGSFKNINLDSLTGQAAIRASTYDYMPIVGPLANHDQFKTVYAKLAKDKNIQLEEECPYYPGLFLNIAHGAKGMLTAPICGEIIADYIDNTPLPCSEKLRNSLHPNRVYIRHLVKSQNNN